MDLLTLRSNVRTRMGIPDNDALFTDAVLTQLVNGALHSIEAEFDWPWLEQTATGTLAASATLDTPVDWMRTISLQVGDYAEVEKVDIVKLRAIPAVSGRPAFYAVFGAALHLRPVPVGVEAFTHLYIRQEPDLVASIDVPLMPATYHQAIVEYAAYLGFRRSGDAPESGGAMAAWQAWRETMIRRHSRYSQSEGGGQMPQEAMAAEQQSKARR